MEVPLSFLSVLKVMGGCLVPLTRAGIGCIDGYLRYRVHNSFAREV